MIPLFCAAALLGGVLTLGQAGGNFAPTNAAPMVRIALVSDTHVRTDGSVEAIAYKAHFAETIKQVNDARVDIVLVAGDLTESGKPDQYDGFQAQIKGFAAPVRVVCGNHDVGAKHLPAKPGEGVTQKRVDDWEHRFGPSFWVTMLKGVRIVGVNSSVLGSGLFAETAQWGFLERELAAPQTTVLVQHYPLFLQTADEPGGGYWNVEPASRARFLALLDQNPHVRAVLSGHLHRPLDTHYQAVRCISTPPVSFGLPKNKQAEGWTLITITPRTGDITSEFHKVADPVGDTATEKKL